MHRSRNEPSGSGANVDCPRGRFVEVPMEEPLRKLLGDSSRNLRQNKTLQGELTTASHQSGVSIMTNSTYAVPDAALRTQATGRSSR